MDKIRFFFIALLGMGAAHLSAQTADSTQTSPWTTEGFAGLKLTQVSLTNWSAGGDNSVAFDLQGTYQANYKKGKHIWNNRLELAYGLNKTGEDGMRKANDKIYMNTNYGYSIATNWYASAFTTFQTQFSPGYDYSVNKDVKYEFLKNMTVYSRLDLYSDYLHKPQNIDVNWEVQINMAINKWFSTTLTTNMVYDDDIKIVQKDGSKGSRLQFKEVLGVGVQFNF